VIEFRAEFEIINRISNLVVKWATAPNDLRIDVTTDLEVWMMEFDWADTKSFGDLAPSDKQRGHSFP